MVLRDASTSKKETAETIQTMKEGKAVACFVIFLCHHHQKLRLQTENKFGLCTINAYNALQAMFEYFTILKTICKTYPFTSA